MKILWMTWKDLKHPLAGGAEVVNEELAKRLVKDGHEVIFLVGGFEGGADKEKISGYTVIRLGNRWSVYWEVFRYYKKYLQGWADLVIDEVNTIPFLAKYYVKEKNILFVHMLCREIWFHQLTPYIGWIGFVLEPVYLWLLRDRVVVTVSDSSKKDLMRFGFREENIHIISEGIQMEPVYDLKTVKKFPQFTVLSLGSVRPMKKTLDQVKAFECAREEISDIKMKLVGDITDLYGQEVVRYVSESEYKDDIEVVGRVMAQEKLKYLQKSHVLLVTSVKEGWGLVVTEAASQGTPSIVYDVDGLRDSVKDGETGIVCKKNTPKNMGEAIVRLYEDKKRYKMFQKNGWSWSKEINFDRSYEGFKKVLRVV